MHFISFIVALVFMVVALGLFIAGLMRLYRGKSQSRGLISSGLVTALVGIIATAVIFGFFTV